MIAWGLIGLIVIAFELRSAGAWEKDWLTVIILIAILVAGVVLLISRNPAESDKWNSVARSLGFHPVYSEHFPPTPFRMPPHLSGCYAQEVAGLHVWIAHRCRPEGYSGSEGGVLGDFIYYWDFWMEVSGVGKFPYRRRGDFDRTLQMPTDRFPQSDLVAVETFALLSHPELKLPRFELRPEGVGDKFSALLGGGDINYPSHPKFSARYFLKGPDEASVGATFGDAALLDFLGEHPGWHIRADGAWMLITRDERIVRPDKLGDFLRDVIELHGQFREAAERQRGTT